MNIATWGYYPPQYENYKEDIYRIIYNVIPFNETISRINEETQEEIIDVVQSYEVWCEYVELPNLTQAIKEHNDVLINKIVLLEKIRLWDISDAVNQFTINEVPVWLDKQTRSGLMLRFDSETAMGKEDTVLWFNNHKFPLNLKIATQMLYAIEDYASKCYDTTQQHYSNVSSLTTVEEYQDYDYQSGYPEKLIF